MDNMNPEKPIGGSEPTKQMGLSKRGIETIAKGLAVGVMVGGMGAVLPGCENANAVNGPSPFIEPSNREIPSLSDLISATIERTKNPTATKNPTETVAPTQNPTATEAPTTNPTVTEDPTPTQTPEVTVSPAPTDGLKIPEGLSQEDYNVRLAVKGAFEYTNQVLRKSNLFALNENEVEQYIASGETSNFNTFELLKDANGKPAFVVIKGGDNGYTPDQMTVVRRTINKMNQLDSTAVSSVMDFGVRILAYDINNSGIFDSDSRAGSYSNNDFGGVVFINPKNMHIDQLITDFGIIAAIFEESRAVYTSRYAFDRWYTNAPDRLDQKIGVDKALWTLQKAKNWVIDDTERFFYESGPNYTKAYYEAIP